jgi:hypothetical protein
MKKNIILTSFFFIGILSLASCTGRVISTPVLGSVYLRDTVLNPMDTINLGDTFATNVRVVDTNLNNGVKINFINGVSGLYNPFIFCIIDTLSGNQNGYRWAADSEFTQLLQLPGRSDSLIFALSIPCINQAIVGVYKIIPKKRGVFFLLAPFGGYPLIWNSSPSEEDLYKDYPTFGNVNRHFNLLLDNTRPVDSMAHFLAGKGTLGNSDIYAFYVK